jgi:predicted O-methyltransferase YrrM
MIYLLRSVVEILINGSRSMSTEGSVQVQATHPVSDHPRNQAGPVGDDPSTEKGSALHQKPALKRRVKTLGKRGLRALFEFGQRFGVDILPRHFYSEIPSIRDLRQDAEWKLPHSMVGVSGADTDVQFEFMESCCTPELVTRLRRNDIWSAACSLNGAPGFGPVDADFLFCFIQAVRPKKIVQVGCGVSTAVMLMAARETTDYRPEIVCIEPYPTDYLKAADRAGEIRLVAEKAQSVTLETLTDLGAGGFLFVDSTHTVKPGSEVNRLVLEVLPRLEPGMWVHFHDVYFPYDYQRGILDDELFFSSESALLHAFMINNAAYFMNICMSILHYKDPSRLGRSLPNYQPASSDHGLRMSDGHFPSSLYLRSS